jgi:hypothetical protein
MIMDVTGYEDAQAEGMDARSYMEHCNIMSSDLAL